jgi:hypothetical protein
LDEDLKSQVEGRLNDLFREDEGLMEPTASLPRVGDHPLKALKARLLSVEWEITDSSMESLLGELKTLEDFYRDDKIILTFLRLLGPTARYVKVRKGDSHPHATGLLGSIYHGLERVALSEDMSRKEKEKILLQEVEKFKKLKEDVIRRRERKKEEMEESAKTPRTESEVAPVEKPAPDLVTMPSREFLAYALDEIKEVIRAEFRALRDEVKRWNESL